MDRVRQLAVVAGIVVMAGMAFYAVMQAESLSEGPVAVAWDHERCAYCRMLLSEPGFAAQLHSKAGDVFHFDDPGCLMLFERAELGGVHARYFHHLSEDRWIEAKEVGFVDVDTSPMGYRLGAVDEVSGEATTYAAASTQVRQLDAERRGH